MLRRVTLFSIISVLVLSVAACGPAPEPPAAEEEPAPPPEPPPPVYELTEVAILEEAPDFTSRNVSLLGIKVGDVTRQVEETLGDITNTRTDEEHYITAYKLGGLVVYTYKLTGKIRRLEITSFMAEEIADPDLRALLEDGDVDMMRKLFGDEQGMSEDEDAGSVEYIYEDRGFRFVKYTIQGQEINAIRFNEVLQRSGDT